jgi:methionine-rich copper-binding protein CopC
MMPPPSRSSGTSSPRADSNVPKFVVDRGFSPQKESSVKSFALAALAALIATPAFAHAHLLQATPADKAVVTAAPSALTLDFSEGVQLKFTGIVVTGPASATVATGTASVSSDGKTLTVPLSGALQPGVYTIAWHALAADGHKTHGTYSFTVK